MYDIFLTSFLIICNVSLSYLFVEESLNELFFICCLENVFNSFTIILIWDLFPDHINRLVLVSGNTKVGVCFLASSKSIDA